MIIGTICTNSHIARALIMADSVKKHHLDSKTVLCLVERDFHDMLKNHPSVDDVILAKDLGWGDFDRYVFKYNALQATCSLKPKLLEFLFENYPKHNKFIYLDTDIRLYSPMEELTELLDRESIVLTPHCLYPFIKLSKHKPISKFQTVHWREMGILKTGMANAGFFALRRNENSGQFLAWWGSKLEHYCYRDRKQGLYDDQKWLDLAPSFFDVHLLKHPGYNVAFWNLMERRIHKQEDGRYTSNDHPLRFFHYSCLDTYLNEMVREGCTLSPDWSAVRSLRNEYLLELARYKWDEYQNMEWSYDRFFNGTKIKNNARKTYRKNDAGFNDKSFNPFSQSNSVFSTKRTGK